ncbi:MAG: dienelactone hydrolase family protein, partial [bacterium]
DDVISRYPVDTNRVYITGLSMGGIGAWYFAIKCPNRFAALAPVAFRGDGWSPCGIKHLPVWAFHGAQDQIIPLAKAEELASEFKRCGGSMKFTVYPDRGHDAWTFAYNNSELYTWLLQHRK